MHKICHDSHTEIPEVGSCDPRTNGMDLRSSGRLTRRGWLVFIQAGDSDFMPELMNGNFDTLGGISLVGGSKHLNDDIIVPQVEPARAA